MKVTCSLEKTWKNRQKYKEEKVCPLLAFCCSVTQSCPTLQPRGLQHARLPCPLLPLYALLADTGLFICLGFFQAS